MEPIEIERQIGAHRDTNDVSRGPARAHVNDIPRFTQQAFSVQESHRKVSVAARRSHGDRNGTTRAAVLRGMVLYEPNFQRFFDRDGIRALHVAGVA